MAMAQIELTGSDWDGTVARLGGEAKLEQEGRATGAFRRPRAVRCAVDYLRLVLAYCLGSMGLRLTAAWAEGIGLGSLSNVALLGRLRNAVPWLESILARLLAQAAGAGACGDARRLGRGRPIRLIDATTVRKAGKSPRESGQLWRIHAELALPEERFGAFELTDETGAERIERLAVVPGEIRIADRVHCRADGLAEVLGQGADVVVRASWRSARWLDKDGRPVDIIRLLNNSPTGRIDQPIWLDRGKAAAPLELRLIAARLPKDKAVKAVAEARAEAKSKQRQVQAGTLTAAQWVMLVTSLAADEYPTEAVLQLYRLRRRIEIAFKRLKSLVGLAGPPGQCPEVAKAWVLCHLIAILLTEAQLAAIGDSPRRAAAHGPTYGALSAC